MACADVQSANVVGYMSQTCGETSDIWGINAGLSLNQVGGGDMVVTDSICGHDLILDDQIKVFNCSYDQFDFYDVTADGIMMTTFTWDGSDQKKVESFTIPAKTGFVYINKNDGDVTLNVSGEVAPSGTQTQTFKYKYEESTGEEEFMFLLVNPFPIDTTLADIDAFATETDDKVKVYNPEYDQHIFYTRTADGWFRTVFTWDGSIETLIDEKDFASTIVIPAGWFGSFIPVDWEKEYVWSVTFNY